MPYDKELHSTCEPWQGQIRVDIGISDHSYRVEVCALDVTASPSPRLQTIASFDWRALDQTWPFHETFVHAGKRHHLEVRISPGFLWGHLVTCRIDRQLVQVRTVEAIERRGAIRDKLREWFGQD